MNYWIIKLKTATLIKILRSKIAVISSLTYIEATKPAGLLLWLLVKLKILSAPVYKIKPRDSVAGPVLYLSSVRNDKGEVITLDVYHHILALRRKIADEFFHTCKDFYFVRKQEKLTHLYAYFSLRIAKDIAPAVYFANYARWKGRGKNIMFIPASDWSEMVADDLKNVVDEVVIDKVKVDNGFSWKVQIVKHILSAFFRLGPIAALGSLGKDGPARLKDLAYRFQYKQNKIMATYGMGILKNRRTDVGYFHASGLEWSQLMLFFQADAHWPPEAEIKWLDDNDIHCAAHPGMTKTIPRIPRWKSSPKLGSIKREFYGLYLHTVSECLRGKNKNTWWLLDRLWDMGMAVSYWKDFFISNHVRIIVNLSPSENNFIPAYAISENDGLAVELERSIRFDYCTYIHNSPHHINFISGPYSLTQVPEPAFSLFTIQSSSINVGDEHYKIEGLDAVRGSKIIVGIFDETANDVFFGDSIRQLYEAAIHLVESDERFFLLIKPKKDRVLEKLADISGRLAQLSEMGRCVRTDWRVTATSAAKQSDLVISVPSTAAFESVVSGTRTIVFNPMRTGSRIFYGNNGRDRRIFEDGKTMIAAVKRFADGRDNTIGDCSDIISTVDVFNDGKGAGRVGNYLEWCLEAFDAGMPQEEVIRAANQRYAEGWGADKITDKNSFETQCGPKFRVEKNTGKQDT